MEDFVQSMSHINPSVGSESVKQHEEWKEKFGAG